ncbi:MAG TPA: DsrE family protein [Thermomicrobiaceae bacterium]|nr:DsrE family protein [Thermomicrobiaceae bacterium]
MANRMLIMMTSGPESPHRLGTPFFQAMAACALDYEATIVTTMDGTLLMKKGVAEGLTVKEGAGKTVLDFIRDAKAGGAQIYVCPASLELHDMTMEDVIPEVDGAMGAARYSEVGLDDDCRVFCY